MIIRTSHPRHRVIALLAGLMAINSYAGFIGLVGGGADFGETINDRLPLGSPVLAGFALLAFVGLPMTVAAIASWRGTRHADRALLAAGGITVGWIVVQLLFIRTYSWMQPSVAIYGLVVASLGWAVRRRGERVEGTS